MSNTDRKFHRRWARESGIPWAKVMRRRPRRHPAEPVKFDIVHDDRVGRRKARQGGVVSNVLRSLASVFGFARRRT